MHRVIKGVGRAFVLGMLCGALLLGVGVVAFQMGSSSVDAQANTNTWGTIYIPKPSNGLNIEDYDELFQQIPAVCDIVMTTQLNYILYRCPDGMTLSVSD